MSSCMPNVPPGFRAGGTCGGHGSCVNSTVQPGLLLCRCDEGYSGGTDFYDNRVEQLPDGTWLSFSCQESRTGEIVVWVFFLLLSLVRFKQLAPLLVSFWKRHQADPKRKAAGILADFPLRIVMFDLFAVTTFLWITAAAKLGGQTLGTDALVTVALSLTVFSFQVGVFDLTREEFKIFVRGTMGGAEAARAKQLRTGLKVFSLLYFVAITVVPSLWALSLEKSLGPIANYEEIAIYLRGLGAVGYGVLDMLTTWMIRRRVTKISANGNDAAVAYIVKKMEGEMRTYIVFMATIGVTYTVFVIPYLHQFQTYPIAIIVGLGALRHSGKAFVNPDDQKAHGLLAQTPSKTLSDVINSNAARQVGVVVHHELSAPEGSSAV